jgi:hypothetical protein
MALTAITILTAIVLLSSCKATYKPGPDKIPHRQQKAQKQKQNTIMAMHIGGLILIGWTLHFTTEENK